MYAYMIEPDSIPVQPMPSGLCEDPGGESVALIARMAKGETAALDELHAAWSPVLLGIATRMLGDRREAEEVVQDTFVRLWHRSAEFDPHKSPPFVWAFAVLRGYCIDRLRYRHRARRDSSRVVSIHVAAPPERSENPRVMALDDWRRLTDWERAGPAGRLFCGTCRAWVAPDSGCREPGCWNWNGEAPRC